MATPYTGAMTVKNAVTGQVSVQPFTCTDVAAAFALFVNNGNNSFFNAPGNGQQQCYITDIYCSLATGTTTTLALRVSQADTGLKWTLVGIQAAVNNRVPTPIPVAGGSSIILTQG